MREENETKQKKNILLPIILIIIILGLVGYILVEKDVINLTSSKQTEEKQTKTNSEEAIEIDISNPFITAWFKQVHGYSIGGDKVIYEQGGSTVDSMTTAYRFDLASNGFLDKITSYTQPTAEGYYAEIKEKIVQEEYEKLFGPNTYQAVATMTAGCNEFTYDPAGKRYVTKSYGCGGTSSFSSHEEIIKAVKYENRIEIISAAVYADGETNSIYKHYNRTGKLATLPKTSQEITTYIKTNKDNLEQYTYTFKLNKDGFYYYSQVKRTKD